MHIIGLHFLIWQRFSWQQVLDHKYKNLR